MVRFSSGLGSIDGLGHRIIEVCVEMLRDFPTRSEPDIVVRCDIPQCFGKRLDPMRLSDEIRMKRYAHHSARVLAFGAQLVELSPDRLAVMPWRIEVRVV